MTWFLIITSIIVLVIGIGLLKVHVTISYKHEQDDDILEITVNLWIIKVYTYCAPLIKIDDDSATLVIKEKHTAMDEEATKKRQDITPQRILDYIHRLKKILQHITGFYRIIKAFWARVSIKDFKWHTVIGVGDAAHSAQITGSIWAVKSGIIGFISSKMNIIERPNISVEPRFQEIISSIQFSCIVSFRIGHAIFAGLMLLKQWKIGRNKKRPEQRTVHSVEENIS